MTSLGFRSLGEERRAQRALKLCGDIAAGPGLPLCPPISVWMATLLKSSGTDLHREPYVLYQSRRVCLCTEIVLKTFAADPGGYAPFMSVPV